ncbi:sulfur carrier protein ThiS [Nocardioides pelophilus]|uniref:sulfur carrier protein ThiS n=1 Tax=Nocardioides pelophilus TaxID=2172019 RepID=UPI001600F30E|nr:sulfur carrier protein ThiS [Nocardioides pelophilus]
MRLSVNGVPAEHSGTIADLLTDRLADPRPHGIAVAVNGEVVRRDDWPRRLLVEGDRVEVVTAVQGG